MIRLSPALLLLSACAGGEPTEIPVSYEFTSRDGSGSSVAYDGQVFRHLLIADLNAHLGALTGRLDAGFFPEAGDVADELEFYFSFDSETSGAAEILWSTDPALLQTTYDDVSSGKDLVGKLAGNDATGQHVDWATAFVGWEAEGVTTPESLVRHWFDAVDAQAVAWANGEIPTDPDGAPVPRVTVTPAGQDLAQLTEKFLRGAIAFSQAADDYLDDDLPDHGLNADHSALAEGKPYTALEHHWDEAFGYFGAAVTYGAWTDEQIAAGARDVDGDGAIDLLTEVSFGHSSNAGKRDLGAVVATDLTADAWAGFALGRQLLAETDGALSEAELEDLKKHRDTAIEAWEAAIAATVVHYLNEVIVDTGKIGGAEYDFGDHAKHWSEAKGFALAFQFNPRSPVSDADFARLHALIREAPVLSDADATAREAYIADLIEARGLLGDAFGFDAANLGGDDGLGGW